MALPPALRGYAFGSLLGMVLPAARSAYDEVATAYAGQPIPRRVAGESWAEHAARLYGTLPSVTAMAVEFYALQPALRSGLVEQARAYIRGTPAGSPALDPAGESQAYSPHFVLATLVDGLESGALRLGDGAVTAGSGAWRRLLLLALVGVAVYFVIRR